MSGIAEKKQRKTGHSIECPLSPHFSSTFTFSLFSSLLASFATFLFAGRFEEDILVLFNQNVPGTFWID